MHRCRLLRTDNLLYKLKLRIPADQEFFFQNQNNKKKSECETNFFSRNRFIFFVKCKIIFDKQDRQRGIFVRNFVADLCAFTSITIFDSSQLIYVCDTYISAIRKTAQKQKTRRPLIILSIWLLDMEEERLWVRLQGWVK